jgi:hypothetical protein
MVKDLEDMIFFECRSWKHKSQIWRNIGGDKQTCFESIDTLVKDELLIQKKVGNRHEFMVNNDNSENYAESTIKQRIAWLKEGIEIIEKLKKPLFKYVKTRKQYEPRTKEIRLDLLALDDSVNTLLVIESRIKLAIAYKIIPKKAGIERLKWSETAFNKTMGEFLNSNDEKEQIQQYIRRTSRTLPRFKI